MVINYDFKAPFKYPKELAIDSANSISVLFYATVNLNEFNEHIILLQITSLLSVAEDNDACIEPCE